MANQLTLGFGSGMVGRFLWHFISLEDLGVPIPTEKELDDANT